MATSVVTKGITFVRNTHLKEHCITDLGNISTDSSKLCMLLHI